MWGVRVGEFAHDLRSALDNLVWQLVLVNGKEPGDHNQFPIYTEANKPPGPTRLKALKGVRGATRIDDMLFGVAPDHAVGVRQKGEGTKGVEHISGPPPANIEVEYELGPIYPGAELFRWRVVGGTDETKVAVEGSVPYDIAFGHPNLTLSTLDWLQKCVSEIVERFAPAFPADPHKV
jgi:hypothetical protein